MIIRKVLLTVLLLTGFSAVHADPNEFYYMVSPASCQPGNSTDAGKLTLTNGAWSMKSGQTGVANLYCPINFSGKDTSYRIDTVVLSYLDEYTANGSDNGYVSAEFKHRSRSAGGYTTAFWTASTYGNGDLYGFDVLTDTENSELANHPQWAKIYYLHVKMYRKSGTNAELAFTGFEIRFD